MKVSISHPHGSLFSYHAARALVEVGWLSSFLTGATSRTSNSRMAPYLPDDLRKRLLNRSYDGVPEHNQRSHVLWEAVSRFGGRIKTFGPSPQIRWYDVLFCGHDWQVSRELEGDLDAVYAYEDGAQRTFDVAKKKNIATLYELPAGYYAGIYNELNRPSKIAHYQNSHIKEEPLWKQERKDVELELADLVVVPCAWARETLKYSKVQCETVVTVPYGTPADNLSERIKKPNGPFTVLFAGQVSFRKGVPYLLEAWERVALKDAQLWLAGSMSLDKIHLNNHAGRFRHLGALPRVQLLEVMKEVDLFVFPPLSEGFGMVIGEAMAVGLPVLTTRNTGGPELITDGREGWCVPTHDVESLIERIGWSYQNRDRLYEMGVSARQRAEKWTWTDYRRKLTNELSQYFDVEAGEVPV